MAAQQETNTIKGCRKVSSGETPDWNYPAMDEKRSTSTRLNGKPRLFWSVVVLILFALLSLAFRIWWDELGQVIGFISDQEAFSSFLQGFGLWGPLVLLIAQTLQVLIAFIPGHMVVITGGYVYGFALGLLMNITFTVAASQLGYLIARWAGRPVVYRLAKPETVDYWERVANQKGVLFFTIAFLLPVFPSDAMNFVAGLSGISARRFLVANFLGRLPSVTMLTLIGAYGLEFSNTIWALVVVAFVLVFVLGQVVVGRIRKSIDHSEASKAQDSANS